MFHSDGRVLLVEHLEGATHLTGVFGLPAGRIEKEEKSIDAAVRELYEETGLKTIKEDLQFVHQYCAKIDRKDGRKTMSFDVYMCKKFEGAICNSIETKPQWVSLNKLEKMQNMLPNVKDAIITVHKRMKE